jgi:hypothetical protein
MNKLFKKFIMDTRPNFKQFSGPDRCLFLTGGRAIKFATKQVRKTSRKKLPSTDYDFKWVLAKKPSMRDINAVFTFFDTLVAQFLVYTNKPGQIISKRRIFENPILQNPLLKRYSYAFCDYAIKQGTQVHDLIDVVVLKMPGASNRILDKATSDVYGLPIPKVDVLFRETLMVVSKTLVATNRNGWRNPLRSTHPKDPNKYLQKGVRNVDRLMVMKNMVENKNFNQNISALNRLIRSNLNTNSKVYIGKLLGLKISNKLK